jgi:hypothetical protein
MTISRLTVVLALLAVSVANVCTAAPRLETVELKPFTHLVAYIPPGGGVKFTFPFVIADGKAGRDFPPFSRTITNPRFSSTKLDDVSASLNSFIVYTPTDLRAGERGNLFFNIAGYEVTVELVGTDQLNKHVTDYYFTIGKEKREELIQDIVAQRTRRLEQEFAERQSKIDAEVERKALARVGELALTRPSSRRVKEEATAQLSNGDKVTLIVDEMLYYGAYTLIPFELTLNSRSAGAPLRGAGIFGRGKDVSAFRPITGGANLPLQVEPGKRVRGVLTALSKEINPDETLKLTVQVDDVSVEVQW